MEKDRIEQLERRIAELEQQNQQLKRDLAGPTTAPQPFDWHKFGLWFFMILSLLAFIPAGLLIWLNRTIIDPERYIQTVGPVIDQPAVQKAITARASSAIFSRVDVEQKVSEALPPQAEFLASPIATQVQSQATNVIAGVVASPKFHDVWVRANQRAQASFINIAESGRASPVVNVNDIYAFIASQLQDTRLAPLLNRQLPPRIGDIQVANVPALQNIPQFVAKLNSWRWIMGLGALIFAILGIWVARDRRWATVLLGNILIVGAVLTFVVVRVARGLLLAKIADPINRAAAEAIWQTILNYLYVQLTVTLVLGLIIVAVGWLLGPGRFALWFRENTSNLFGNGRARLFPDSEGMPLIEYMQRHRRQFEWAVLILTVLVLLALTPLSVPLLIVVVIVALLLLALVEFMALPAVKSRS